MGTDAAEPQVLPDARGLLAWIPWENGHPGSNGAARFVDGEWQDLGPAAGWPQKILHLVPLLDGSVLQLIAGDSGAVQLALMSLDKPGIDEAKVGALVEGFVA